MSFVTSAIENRLQRKCACGGTPGPTGECEECRKKRLQRKEQKPQLRTRGVASAAPIVDEVLSSPGQPLDAGTRAFFESRFGHEFSKVRVHTNTRAAESARSVNALAYTVNRDIVFGEGQWAPHSSRGMSLLAHELAHTIQQGDRHNSGAERLALSKNAAPSEHEAKVTAQAVESGFAAPVKLSAVKPVIARQTEATNEPTQGSGSPSAPAAPVFFCSKKVALGFSHAFFRVGGSGTGNPTFELEHDEIGDHCPCGFQGWPTRDYPEDRDDADAPCILLPGVTPACLAANYLTYPIGRYCATGPNSNTYARWLAEKCGAVGKRPPGRLPGFGDSPPVAGTAAPPSFPGTGVLGTVGVCGSIACDNDFCVVSD
jgi:hypothetical protein